MGSKKPKVVIIGAGMAGLTAANKLYKTAGSKELLEVCVVEGGNRIGGRINTSEFCGDRIEMGATWIHGIIGSPVYKIAQQINSLQSQQPWECMDGDIEPLTIAEGRHELNSSLVESISDLFNKLMDFAQGKLVTEDGVSNEIAKSNNGLSLGSFLRKGLDAYWESVKGDREDIEVQGIDKWSKRSLEEGIFAMFENIQRTYTSAGDLQMLDFSAEKEYRMFPGEEITIAKGYLSVIESLASVLPPGLIQLGRKVAKIEWQPEGSLQFENGTNNKAVKLHFVDGSIMYADHVIVTVSLGVLKQGINQDSGMFNPPLPHFKTQAISRLGFGVVNKLFLKLNPTHNQEYGIKFPYLQMVFHQTKPNPKIPWWMRRTANLCPIYSKSSVLLSWFAGKEALELESLDNEEIIDGFSKTISSFLLNSKHFKKSNDLCCNGHAESNFKVEKVLKSQWGSDPLFLGSYSYVAVGSSGDDLDIMAEPLPKRTSIHNSNGCSSPPLQILFAGEATHRTHYSTTHGAYFSGLREANRLLNHYHFMDI
ncbi:putative polyamine oxidase 5 isoform X1 [Nicotiana tabacum]|uniref:Polyamine oxidase 5 isoform X1 n=2 Tax=Nicotiana TaxID=4085 RepID=A0A1S4C0L5_TOBAC|nr:PREDICTED: probable polyamine oxidase 5 [Nicotiana sylvestris]XP_016494589.1 PREDICTED: probable polyamine oxidase 5 [Nicotiana tabacum]